MSIFQRFSVIISRIIAIANKSYLKIYPDDNLLANENLLINNHIPFVFQTAHNLHKITLKLN